MKPQATPLPKSSGAREIVFGTQGNFDNSPMETSPCQSPNKASDSSTMSVMMIETTSLEDQVANLTKLVEELSTSLKAKDHEIAKLMNKLESLNEGGQTSTTKAFQVDQLDVIEESAIGAVKNICGITDDIFTNQLKRTHQGSHHRPGGKLNSTLVFVCEAVHPKNRPVKDASKLPTTKVSTIRWQRKSSATYSSLCGDLQQCRD